MTHDELQALRRLADAATPGPWHTTRLSYDVGVFPRSHECIVVTSGTERTNENAAFIAAARDAVPALIAEVERLQADYDRLCDALTRLNVQNNL